MAIENFNPNNAASNDAGIFGLPHEADEAKIIIIPIEWEVTVSYGSGASEGPFAVYDASFQLDLCHHDYPELWKEGVYMDDFPEDLRTLSKMLKSDAQIIIENIENGVDTLNDPVLKKLYCNIQDGCETLNSWVFERVAYWKSQGKIVGLLGGDHSTPYGYIKYLSTQYSSFGVLTVDAHMDLRNGFEGFLYSHASIFYNVLQLPEVSKMVQVGIRDYCHEEKDFVAAQGDRLKIFYDRDMQRAQYFGKNWNEIVQEIIGNLPENVYVTVDIDGLNPHLCPNTGTPVPGGLEFEQLAFLLHEIGKSGKKLIGFDLCEVSPGDNEWDGNVGARVLYQLCGMASTNLNQ